MSTIYVIRHGQASFGKENYDVLSEKGREQSQFLAEHFYNIGLHFDIAYTGTMERHIGTAAEYFSMCRDKNISEPAVIKTENLNEYDTKKIMKALVPVIATEDDSLIDDFGKMFTDKRSFQKIFEAVLNKWISGDYNHGLEKWEDFKKSVNSEIDEILKKHGRGKNIGIFTSGGIVSAFVQRALGLSDADTLRVTWQVVNSSVTRFKCTQEKIMVSGFNEYSHLELAGDKFITYR